MPRAAPVTSTVWPARSKRGNCSVMTFPRSDVLRSLGRPARHRQVWRRIGCRRAPGRITIPVGGKFDDGRRSQRRADRRRRSRRRHRGLRSPRARPARDHPGGARRASAGAAISGRSQEPRKGSISAAPGSRPGRSRSAGLCERHKIELRPRHPVTERRWYRDGALHRDGPTSRRRPRRARAGDRPHRHRCHAAEERAWRGRAGPSAADHQPGGLYSATGRARGDARPHRRLVDRLRQRRQGAGAGA